jgi:hypothetical protein
MENKLKRMRIWRSMNCVLQRESVLVFIAVTREEKSDTSEGWVSSWRQIHLKNLRLITPPPPSLSRFLPLIDGESGIHNRPTKEELKKSLPWLTETAAGSYVPHLQT